MPACSHLSKNFDNVHNLEFAKDAAGEPTKNAISMYSGALITSSILDVSFQGEIIVNVGT